MVTADATGHDTLQRRKRLQPISTGKRVTPQERDLLWFAKLREHGPLPSSFLLDYGRQLCRNDKRARERLTDLFNEDNTHDGGRYLSRPPQQFRTIDSRYNQLVYDLTPAAERALRRTDLWTERSMRAGPWLHGFMVSCITASVELATLARTDLRYIPQSQILERAKAELRFPAVIESAPGRTLAKDLIPDAVFGLEYLTDRGSRFRFFVVEADRATEPSTSRNFNRKSFERSLMQYEHYIGRGKYREHLKLTAPLLVLHVCSDAARTIRMIARTARHGSAGNAHMLFQSWEDFGPAFRPPSSRSGLLDHPWQRAALPPFRIDQVDAGQQAD